MKRPRSHPVLGTLRRPAFAYLLVLFTSMLLVAAGLGAVYAAGVRRATTELGIEGWQARMAAEAGIDFALEKIRTDSSWRVNYSGGSFATNAATRDGQFSVTGTDTIDGVIINNIGDPIDLVSVGASGRGRSKLKVTLNSQTTTYTCLAVAMSSAGAQTYTSATISNLQTISSNAACTAVLSSVSGRVESTLTTTGVTFTGTAASLQPARTFPDATVFSTYTAAGAGVSLASVPTVSGKKTLERVAIGPGSAPAGGATNASGIYVLDCGGADIIVQNCRVFGTLVLLNTGAGSKISGSVNFDAAVANYPCLLVSGPITMDFDTTATLRESTMPTANFNPTGMPYSSNTDMDQADTYPSEIRGLVYVSGALSVSGHPKVVGNLVVGGAVTVTGALDIDYLSTFATSPPPGFASTSMQVMPGSWKQLVD